MSLDEKKYSVLTVAAFSLKIDHVDKPKALMEDLKNLVSEIKSDPELGKEGFEIEQNGIKYSAVVDKADNLVVTSNDGNQVLSVKLDTNNNAVDVVAQRIDSNGVAYDETRIHTDLDTNRSVLTHATDGVEDVKGVVVGKLTQDKLDQFAELGSSALNSDAPADSAQNDAPAADNAATSILSSLDVKISDDALDALDTWFEQSDAIVIEPYRWENVDATLQALWHTSSDEVLAAYDLGDMLAQSGWDSDIGGIDGTVPDVAPTFADLGNGAPDPIYVPSYDNYAEANDGIAISYDDYLASYNDPAVIASNDWTYSPYDYANTYVDPVVLKLGAGSVHTTNRLGSTVMFDMNADGIKDKTGWITADEGFLVIDKNGNGKIDDITEMFSEYSSTKAKTGFGALAAFDKNHDGYADKWDRGNFGKLRLWIDINVNGVTDKGELHALKEFGIVAIGVKAPAVANHFDNGNLILSTQKYGWDVNNVRHWGQAAEVLFNFGDQDPLATVYLSDQSSTVRTESGKVIEVLTGNGAQKINASLSGVNVLVGGAGDTLNAGNAGQSILIGNGKTTMNGNAGEVHFIVNGSGNVVNTGAGSSWIEVNGDANKINAGKGDVTLEVDGNRNTITIGSGADVTLGGVGNTLTAGAKTHDNDIVVTGTKEVINVSNADIEISDHASATLNGKNNDITMDGNATLSGKASGGTLTVSGENNVATLTGSFIAMTEGSGLTLTGGGHQVVMGGDANLTMKSSGAGSTIVVTGDDNQLNANNAKVILDEGAELDLKGTGDKLSLLGDGTLTATGTGHVVDVYGSGNEVTANRSTVNEHAFADLKLTGTGNTLKVTPDNSTLAPKDLAAQAALEQLLDKALAHFDELAGELSAADAPADDVGLPAAGMLALVGTDLNTSTADYLH